VCGQYQGAVRLGATVALKCYCDLAAYRYVIIQFPITDCANVVEVDVYVSRKFLIPSSAVIVLCYVMLVDLTTD